ncbi:MAG: hypothetical protein U5J98_05890 [Halobacteriales archaeon]|nr:hypothetical protein [Halobacteriales archaeon]
MSTALGSRVALAERLGTVPTAYRAFALTGAAVLTAAYLAALYHVVDVVGGPGGMELFVAVVAGSLGLAIVLARTLRLRHAVVLGAVLLVAGLGVYLGSIPRGRWTSTASSRTPSRC